MKSVEQIFREENILRAIPDFEPRTQQVQMSAAIERALRTSKHLIVEAPTGVGKSIAYLVPAILHAVEHKKKAIISTHTKNLQEQLILKDIPLAEKLTGAMISVAMFKGRRNYLCTSRLRNVAIQQKFLLGATEAEEVTRLEDWADSTLEGDRDAMPFPVSDSLWSQVCSEKGTCSTKNCGSACFFQKAKVRAREADLLVVNHSLFFSLFAIQPSEEFFLFKDDFIVIDEAHTL